MKNGFRQSMAWLHTWTGVVVGWILLFVFVTGTASYASREINRWMQPEQPIPSRSSLSAAEQFDIAYRHLLDNPASRQSSNWTVNFIHTGRGSNQLTASWNLPPAPGQNRGRTESVMLDSTTGETMERRQPRETAGGRALIRMHYALHYIPYDWAIRIVGICTMLMFAALVTGVITHRKIFQDFFTFRSGKGQRSWMDAHNVIGVVALPFYLMITYSGLLFFMYTYMPLGVPLTYGFDAEDRQAYYTELSAQTGSNRLVGRSVGGGGARGAATVTAMEPEAADDDTADAPRTRNAMNREGNAGGERSQGAGGGRGAGGERGEGTGSRTADGNAGGERGGARTGRGADGENPGRNSDGRGGSPATVYQQTPNFADLSAVVRQVESEWGHQGIRAATLTATGGSAPVRLQLARANMDTLRTRGGNVEYNAFTGERLPASGADTPAPEVFGRTMLGLHEGQFATPLMRWLYVVSGILGSALIATGLVMWAAKRRARHAQGGAWTFGHALVEKLNLVAVAGLPFALAIYFWSNRLLPVAMENRAAWEIHSMFIAWFAILVYSLLRPSGNAWRELLVLVASAWLLLPVLNLITSDRHLLVTVPSRDWALVSVDAAFIGLGLMFAWAAWKVHARMVSRTRQPAPSKAPVESMIAGGSLKGHV